MENISHVLEFRTQSSRGNIKVAQQTTDSNKNLKKHQIVQSPDRCKVKCTQKRIN